MNPISVAVSGKGSFALMKRMYSISRRYGPGPSKVGGSLARFVEVLQRFGCSATFPITGVALARNSAIIEKLHSQGIEFAIHGYRHIDHSELSQAEQLAHLTEAQRVFSKAGIRPTGFRGPYLRWNSDTLSVLRQRGFDYESSQAIAWDVTAGHDTAVYRRALDFYRARPARDHLSLPSLDEGLVRIPYSLPDDEALVERLDLRTTDQMNELWLALLQRTYELGELFTLGLHPERASLCLEPLTAVLAQARLAMPPVWIARLDEVSSWWRARAEAIVEIADVGDGGLQVSVTGAGGTTILARGVRVDTPTEPWADGYQRVREMTFTVRSPKRPFIGLAPGSSPKLAGFFRQLGYIVEVSKEDQRYSYYFCQTEFTPEHERRILDQVEGTGHPLVRLGRWPDGARSALAITGDIDALTLWDYGLRFLGR